MCDHVKHSLDCICVLLHLFADRPEQRHDRLQVPRSVWFVQCQDLLASTSKTSRDRRETEEALLHSHGSGTAPRRVEAQTDAHEWQIVHVPKERPDLRSEITRLLPKGRQNRVTWYAGKVS